MTSLGMEGERMMIDGRCIDSDEDIMVYWPARVICGKGVSCSCLNMSTPRGELVSEAVGISSSMEVRQRPWDEINYTPIHSWCRNYLPLRQFVLMRNIRFQSWISVTARPGRFLVSRSSLRPAKPLKPRRRSLPNSRR